MLADGPADSLTRIGRETTYSERNLKRRTSFSTFLSRNVAGSVARENDDLSGLGAYIGARGHGGVSGFIRALGAILPSLHRLQGSGTLSGRPACRRGAASRCGPAGHRRHERDAADLAEARRPLARPDLRHRRRRSGPGVVKRAVPVTVSGTCWPIASLGRRVRC